MTEDKFILDPMCGGRHFWFNKQHPNVIYGDIRVSPKGSKPGRPNHEVKPDEIMDCRNLRFQDKTFKLIVLDPPHLIMGEKAILRVSYGSLDKTTWKADLKKAIDECWRVLDDYGILIFKWNEEQVLLKEILLLFEFEPLFGHTTGSKSHTHWLCFMKIPGQIQTSKQERLGESFQKRGRSE